MICCQVVSEHAVSVRVEILLRLFISSVKSALLVMFSHGSGNRSVCSTLRFILQLGKNMQGQFSKRTCEVTLQIYALPRVFPRVLNSFRDAKETAIETTT